MHRPGPRMKPKRLILIIHFYSMLGQTARRIRLLYCMPTGLQSFSVASKIRSIPCSLCIDSAILRIKLIVAHPFNLCQSLPPDMPTQTTGGSKCFRPRCISFFLLIRLIFEPRRRQ
jgi:hypothetical protein